MKKTILLLTFVMLLSTTLTACSFQKVLLSDKKDKQTTEVKQQKNEELYHSLVSFENLIYKTDNYGNSLSLDIFLPHNNATNLNNLTYSNEACTQNLLSFNTVIFVHGGSFIRGSKKDVLKATRKHTIPALLKNNYAVISIDYTLIDENHKFPENIIDVLDALAWIKENGATYHLNTDTIGLMGTSAGGSLSILVSEQINDTEVSEYKKSIENKLPTINYIIDLSAPTSLYDYFKENPIDTVEKLKTYSPINCTFSKKIPLLIFHGDADTVVHIKDSENLCQRLKQSQVPFVFEPIPNANHGLVPADKKTREHITKTTLQFIHHSLQKDANNL